MVSMEVSGNEAYHPREGSDANVPDSDGETNPGLDYDGVLAEEDDDPDFIPEAPTGVDPFGGDEEAGMKGVSGHPDSPQAAGTPSRSDYYHRFHPVGRYTSKDWRWQAIDPGDTVHIPTSLTERTTFTKGRSEWGTNHTMAEYRETLFADDYFSPAPEYTSIAGGESAAMANGKVVLDLGSGEAVALLQFSEVHPATVFIGVDAGYEETRRINLESPGVQLTKDDWHTLEQIPDKSIDTVLSQRGVIPWGISPETPRSSEIADAIDRVAKVGAVWRFDISALNSWRSCVTKLMTDRGWSVKEVVTPEGKKFRTMVAVKGNPEQDQAALDPGSNY